MVCSYAVGPNFATVFWRHTLATFSSYRNQINTQNLLFLALLFYHSKRDTFRIVMCMPLYIGWFKDQASVSVVNRGVPVTRGPVGWATGLAICHTQLPASACLSEAGFSACRWSVKTPEQLASPRPWPHPAVIQSGPAARDGCPACLISHLPRGLYRSPEAQQYWTCGWRMTSDTSGWY